MAAPRGFSDDPAGFFARLSEELGSDHNVAATLQRICERALDVAPAADFCGITVRRRRGRLDTLAHTHDLAILCDELQYELDEGPCVSSVVEDEPFMIRSTGQDPRWPRWGRKVAELGVNSLVSVQLSAGALDSERDPLGAVNVYACAADAFDSDDVQRFRLYGVHAGNALATAHMVTTLREAVDSRHEIGLAQGILMSRYGLDREQAFESLQRYSSHANVKLRAIACLVIDTGELPASYDLADRDHQQVTLIDQGE